MRALDSHVDALKHDMRGLNDFEYRARDLCDRLALGLQASALVRSAPDQAAEAFCRSRLETRGQRNYGALDRDADVRAIVKRAAAR